jgi:chromosome segregation ATPase
LRAEAGTLQESIKEKNKEFDHIINEIEQKQRELQRFEEAGKAWSERISYYRNEELKGKDIIHQINNEIKEASNVLSNYKKEVGQLRDECTELKRVNLRLREENTELDSKVKSERELHDWEKGLDGRESDLRNEREALEKEKKETIKKCNEQCRDVLDVYKRIKEGMRGLAYIKAFIGKKITPEELMLLQSAINIELAQRKMGNVELFTRDIAEYTKKLEKIFSEPLEEYETLLIVDGYNKIFDANLEEVKRRQQDEVTRLTLTPHA